jgi:hypothetical protein
MKVTGLKDIEDDIDEDEQINDREQTMTTLNSNIIAVIKY